MKKILGTVISILMLIGILSVFKLTAHARNLDDFDYYPASEKTVLITGYKRLFG